MGYRCLQKIGAGKGTRTLDPDLGKVVLYQLSYSRSGTEILDRFPGGCQHP